MYDSDKEIRKAIRTLNDELYVIATNYDCVTFGIDKKYEEDEVRTMIEELIGEFDCGWQLGKRNLTFPNEYNDEWTVSFHRR